jgi:hypothetical protein
LSFRRCYDHFSPLARVFVLALDGLIEFCVSGSIYAEHEEVVNRPI